jgi:anti-sigma B factor antagonist
LRAVTILEVETEERDGLVRLTLRGELDLSTVDKVEHELAKAESADAPTVVVDLSSLTFLDSTGLRAVVTADERLRGRGGRLVIVRGPESVHRVFTITRLDERLEIVDDSSQAPSAR